MQDFVLIMHISDDKHQIKIKTKNTFSFWYTSMADKDAANEFLQVVE